MAGVRSLLGLARSKRGKRLVFIELWSCFGRVLVARYLFDRFLHSEQSRGDLGKQS